jgi:hypothetical protein
LAAASSPRRGAACRRNSTCAALSSLHDEHHSGERPPGEADLIMVASRPESGPDAAVDAIRLLPAKRPTSDLPSGFGFPRKLRVSVSETGNSDDWQVAAERRGVPGRGRPHEDGRAAVLDRKSTRLNSSHTAHH